MVLVLDDLHWADKPSLVLLRHLLRSPTPMRVLFLGTYRDTDLDRSHPLSDVLGELRRQPGVDRLDLQGLDEDEISGFMANVAGHELTEGGRDLAEALHTETEGNPFFVGEVLRHLAESGAIVQDDDGRWTTSGAVADFGIPEGVREVVGRRLSRLSDAVNRALAIGAVIGPTFDLATIEGAGGPAATSCSTRSTRPRSSASSGRRRARRAGTRSRTRSCARRCTRSSRPTGACACTGASARCSRRGTRRSSTSISTSSRSTTARARWPATRPRRRSSRAGPGSARSRISRSSRPRATSNARSDRWSWSTTPRPRHGAISCSRGPTRSS